MTEQDQYLACAELDGYVREQAKSLFDPRLDVTYWYRDSIRTACCPDYSTRDAVIAVIEKTCSSGLECSWHTFCLHLISVLKPAWFEPQKADSKIYPIKIIALAFIATPAQLREALLRATGKWKEQWRKDPEP